MNNNFYTYLLYDPDEEFPFYVGKGSNHRLSNTIKLSKNTNNPIKLSKLKKIYSKNKEVKIELIGNNLSEIEAIEYFGLIKDGEGGCLSNLTYGGEGTSGWNHSEETKEKISKGHIGKKLSKEHREKLSISHIGKILSDETKEKVRLTSLGRNHSNETKQKISNSRKGITYFEETLIKMSDSQKKKLSKKENHPMYGKHHKEKTKEKIKKAFSIKISIDGIIYNSSKEASKILNMSRNTIRQRINDINNLNYFKV